jgi:hypothetical protein
MNLKKSFAALAVLALIVVGIVALFVPTATQGQENNGNGPPANNPRPSELLSLRTGLECPDTFSGARIVSDVLNPDGTTAANAYAVPPGKVFVITDMYFTVDAPPGDSTSMRFGVPCGTGCMKPLMDVIAIAGSNGTAAAQVSLQHGIVVQPGVTLCVASGPGHANPRVEIQGYLASDR